ncbi:MAG: hypothetical protein JO112_00410 [Planctomycetes bacterium]|nr:hypothetical protein [Planctomycetota bacterium]
MRKIFLGLIGMLLPWPLLAAQTQTVPAGTPVTITVSPAAPSAPPVSINLKGRHGHVTPFRQGFTHTGGGTIDVQQPTPDALVITMFGVVVAGPHPCKDSVATLNFDLCQDLEISFDDPKVKKAKFSLEARAIGLLRSEGMHHGCGGASISVAAAAVNCETSEVIAISLTPHSVGGGENLSINDHEGPVEQTPIMAGKYTYHQTFVITAEHTRGIIPSKAASAEFDPTALDPLWISYWEPFHGATKKDFGFQVILKVADDTPKEEPKAEEKKDEKKNGDEKKPEVRLSY